MENFKQALKKITAVLMIAVLLVGIAQLGNLADVDWSEFALVASAEELTEVDYSYTVSNGEAMIRDYNGDGGDIVIPSELGGYPVTRIGYEAFENCYRLTSVTIGNGVTYIGEYAFYGCTSLASITIPDSVTSIGECAFYNTAYYNNENNWENHVIYIGNHLIASKTSITGSYTVKNGTKTIASFAFENCYRLTSVTIPDSVTIIDGLAFSDCTSLASITIGDSVESIGVLAFYRCESLISVTIPDSVTSIGYEAFGECHSLASVTIPDSVTSIGDDAFYECYSLTSVTIPDSITSIGECAFSSCARLEKVTIGKGLTEISSYMFSECAELNEIIIPDNIISIGDNAFDGCNSLKNVFFTGTDAEWNSITIGTYNQNLTDLPVHFEAIDHTWIVDEAKEATCTETGLTEGKRCSTCQLIEIAQETIPASGHTVVIDEAVEPTCVSVGLTEGKHCSVCQTVLVEQRILAAKGEHNSDNGTVLSEPTCESIGITIYKCIDCSAIIDMAVSEKLSHSEEVLPAVSATCTQTGLTEGKVCSACGTVIVKQEVIPQTEHRSDEGTVLSDLTCSHMGIKVYECLDCGTVIEIVTTEKLPHAEKTLLAVAPTCTHSGLTEGLACNVCGEVIIAQEEVPITSHSDNNNNGYCDSCDEYLGEEEENCSCNCHKSGFMGFIWKILNVFYKIFRTNKFCDCGVTHY